MKKVESVETVQDLMNWIKENFDQNCAKESAYHLIDLNWVKKERQPMGLADNVWLKSGEGPYSNCPVYRIPEGLRIIIEGNIHRICDQIEYGEYLKKEFSEKQRSGDRND